MTSIKLFNTSKKATLYFFIVFFFSIVTACTTSYAPVEDRVAANPNDKIATYYQVNKGDTLYSIAWKYNQDYKTLALINNIKVPYTIYVGQKIHLNSYQEDPQQKTNKVKKNKKKVTYKKNNTAKSSSYSGSKDSGSKDSGSKDSGSKDLGAKDVGAKYSGAKKLSWMWPIKGKIIQKYNPAKNKKGIDIAAKQGVLIKASEAGKVVYTGQSLVGYGLLIIIMHDERFLSAYGHNQNLLVDEGQLVKKGQTIAQLGRSGTNRYKLHFEIRKNGRPVNPMHYLPH